MTAAAAPSGQPSEPPIQTGESLCSRSDSSPCDTFVVIDVEHLDPETLPAEVAVTAVCLAECADGLTRQGACHRDRPQRAEATSGALPFDSAARVHGLIVLSRIAKEPQSPRNSRQ